MMYRIGAAVAGLSFLAVAVPASAQTSESDVRCLIVSKFYAANEKDPAKKQLSILSAFFYLGRIDARMTVDQLKAQAAAPSGQIKAADAGPIMTECAKKLQISEKTMMNVQPATPAATAPKK